MDDLKPCPFCGGKAYAVWNAIINVRNGSGVHEERGVCIYCENCPAQIRTTAKHLAKEMWNRREPTDYVEDAQTVGGWISVKDRLPDKSGTYLCYQATAAKICSLNTVRWSTAKDDWMGKEVGSRITGITHWMPLPEPPEVT